jgi:hypothetical protein
MQDKPSANLPRYVSKVVRVSHWRNQSRTIVPHVPDGTAHLPSLHFFSRVSLLHLIGWRRPDLGQVFPS